jgi:hypothetical protein
VPAKSKVQQEAAGADLARVRAGKTPRTFKGMSETELVKFASTKRSKLPQRLGKKKKTR